MNFEGNTHYNDGFYYKAWHNCFELANLNLWDRGVKDYLLDVVRFWIDEFDIDGIRLDCADCLQFDFMKELRWVTSQKKADFWLMGEVIHGDYARWVNDEMLHSVTNYELWKGLYSGHNEMCIRDSSRVLPLSRKFSPMHMVSSFRLFSTVLTFSPFPDRSTRVFFTRL